MQPADSDPQTRVSQLSKVVFNAISINLAASGTASHEEVFAELFETTVKLAARVCSGNGLLSGQATDTNIQTFYLELMKEVAKVEPPKPPETPKFSPYLM